MPAYRAATLGGGLAVVAWSLAIGASGPAQLALPAGIRIIASDAFLLEAAAAVVVAPVAGVALAARRAEFLTGLLGVTTMSMLLASLASWQTGQSTGLVITGHAGFAAVTLALAGIGWVLAASLRDPLDAAGAAFVLSLTASVVILAGGPATAELSERTINAGLLASPLIAITSAGQMDILRGDVLYQLAPISHRRFSYPAWQTTTVTYGTLAAVCFAFTRKGSSA